MADNRVNAYINDKPFGSGRPYLRIDLVEEEHPYKYTVLWYVKGLKPEALDRGMIMRSHWNHDGRLTSEPLPTWVIVA